MFTKKKKSNETEQQPNLDPLLRDEHADATVDENQPAESRDDDEVAPQSDATAETPTETDQPQTEETGPIGYAGEPDNESDGDNDQETVDQPSADEPEPPLYSIVEKAYCLGAGIDEETLGKAKQMLGNISESVSSGRFDPDVLQMAIRLLNYDQAIQQAHREGLELGRTENITEIFRNKRDKAKEADAIPHLGGTKLSTTNCNTIFDIAREVQ